MRDHVLRDLYCVTCRYNLRTLSICGRCPECGTSVQETIISLPAEPRAQLVGAFVGYVTLNLAVLAILRFWNQGIVSDAAPMLYLHGPILACVAVGASRYFGNRLRFATYFAFLAAMGLVGISNFYVLSR